MRCCRCLPCAGVHDPMQHQLHFGVQLVLSILQDLLKGLDISRPARMIAASVAHRGRGCSRSGGRCQLFAQQSDLLLGLQQDPTDIVNVVLLLDLLHADLKADYQTTERLKAKRMTCFRMGSMEFRAQSRVRVPIISGKTAHERLGLACSFNVPWSSQSSSLDRY